MKRIIELSSTGSMNLKPDSVTVSFAVREWGEQFREVENNLNKRVAAFRSLVESVGFEKQDLVSDSYRVEQRFEYDEDTNRYPAGFEGVHRLSIKFELDQDRLDKLLRTLYPSLQDIPYTVKFGLSDREAFKNEVIDIAVKKGISEAEQLAKSAGVNLGPILKLNYGSQDYPEDLSYKMARLEESSDDDYVTPGFQPSELSLSQTVYMKWAIVD